jgi:hypothetical protein
MAEKEIPVLDEKQLEAKLKEILETWPLYREFRYKGGEGSSTVPLHLSLSCSYCGKEQSWETHYAVSNQRTGFSGADYNCRNCDKRVTKYFFFWNTYTTYTEFFKVGQYPPLEEVVSPGLQKALGKIDLAHYTNALRLRNFNMGIGAVAYLRRIVENHMNDVLDTIYEASLTATTSPNILSKLEEIKSSRGFKEKIEFAESILPPRLRPDGVPKPFAILYDLTSDALHARSEDESIKIFDECRRIFEYLFSELHKENAGAREFKLALANAPLLKPSFELESNVGDRGTVSEAGDK